MKHRKPDFFRSMTVKKALILALAALLAAAMVVVALFVYRTAINPKAAFDAGVYPQPVQPAQGTGSPQVSAEASAQVPSGRVNILLLGMDSDAVRLESDRVDFRTDTMLLLSIDFDRKRADMITVPRDSYVTVTNATGSLYKVNSAAYFGGGMCDSGCMNACDTISGVFGGIPIGYYAAVNMDGLCALIDAMGGVYYDVDVSVSDTLHEGYQLLNGNAALAYCRVRNGIGTDIDRQQRQQKLLVAIFEQLKENGKIGDIPQIYEAVSGMVYTNLSFEQICALAVFAKGLDTDYVGRHVLEGEYHWAYGVYYYLLDQQAKADLVREIFGIDIGIDEKHDIHYVLSDPDANADRRGTGEPDAPSATPTPEATPDTTPSVTPSDSPDTTPSATPSDSPDATPSATPADSPDATPSSTPSDSPDATPSATPSDSPSTTLSATPSASS